MNDSVANGAWLKDVIDFQFVFWITTKQLHEASDDVGNSPVTPSLDPIITYQSELSKLMSLFIDQE